MCLCCILWESQGELFIINVTQAAKLLCWQKQGNLQLSLHCSVGVDLFINSVSALEMGLCRFLIFINNLPKEETGILAKYIYEPSSTCTQVRKDAFGVERVCNVRAAFLWMH